MKVFRYRPDFGTLLQSSQSVLACRQERCSHEVPTSIGNTVQTHHYEIHQFKLTASPEQQKRCKT